MSLRSWLWILLAGALAGGCSVSRERRAAAGETTSVVPGGLPLSPESDDAVARRAEAHAHYAAAVVDEVNGNAGAALAEYYQAALKDPGDETLILEVSREFLRAKQPIKALEILRRATARPGASGAIYARLSFVCTQLGRHDLAVKSAREAVKKQPRLLAGYQSLYLNYIQSNQMAEAIGVLDGAARVDGVDAEFLIGLAELYSNVGLQVSAQRKAARAEALEILERAEKLDISDPATGLRLADGFDQLGNTERAAEIYQSLVKKLSGDPVATETIRTKLADIYLRDQKSDRAAAQLEALVRNDPTDARAWYFLGGIAYGATNYAKADDYFSKALLLDPDFEPAYYDLAGAQIAEGKAGEALDVLEKAKRKFSQNFLMEYLLGSACGRQKDFTNAIGHFTTAEIIAGATDPKRLTDVFYFEFGAACERAGQIAQAEKYFEKCLKLSPHFAEAQNYLGYMWAERGQNLGRARELIQQAVEADPKNAAYLDSMGWVLFKSNQPKSALEYELKAVQFSGEPDAEVYDHLGDIYAALNEAEKARAAWRKSLSLQPSPAVQEKLEAGK